MSDRQAWLLALAAEVLGHDRALQLLDTQGAEAVIDAADRVKPIRRAVEAFDTHVREHGAADMRGWQTVMDYIARAALDPEVQASAPASAFVETVRVLALRTILLTTVRDDAFLPLRDTGPLAQRGKAMDQRGRRGLLRELLREVVPAEDARAPKGRATQTAIFFACIDATADDFRFDFHHKVGPGSPIITVRRSNGKDQKVTRGAFASAISEVRKELRESQASRSAQERRNRRA